MALTSTRSDDDDEEGEEKEFRRGANASSPRNVDSDGELEDDGDEDGEPKSLIIPITTSSGGKIDPDLFVEIFPEEIPAVPTSTMLSVLKDERAGMKVWADAALGYVRGKKMREGADVLAAACEAETELGGDREEKLRLLAASGIANLIQAAKSKQGGAAGGGAAGGGGASSSAGGAGGGGSSSQGDKSSGAAGGGSGDREDLRAMAEDRFTQATRIDQFFPMTWVGKGMLNLPIPGRLDQARFFFDTTLKHAGPVLPALLGMAAVKYAEKDYKAAQELFGRAIALYPNTSGASVRVGYGMCCYKLGQVDRAKAAFRRAYQIDSDNVEAMAGIAVLDLSTLDPTAKDYLTRQENGVQLLSMANLVDRSNAVVQNHLADHYFWKWSLVPGTASVERGSNVVRGSAAVNVDPGERVRIGTTFETVLADEDEQQQHQSSLASEGGSGGNEFVVRDAWTAPSAEGLKLWRKDYDRVVDMAKGALNSTDVPEVQAESVFLLARVFHVRGDFDEAARYYNKACKLAPSLTPARFGLAQCLIWQESFDEAATHLRLVLANSPMATDAHAALGLLEAKAGTGANKDRKEALSHLKKAAELDPLDPNLVLIQALALQQHESDYPQALEKYRKAVEIMENQGRPVPPEVLTNIGVLCQEMKQYDEALNMYAKALSSLTSGTGQKETAIVEEEGCIIREESNKLFWTYVDSGFFCAKPTLGGSKKILISNPKGEGGDIALKVFRIGDHVRLGDKFASEITDISTDHGSATIVQIRDVFVTPTIQGSTGDAAENEAGGDGTKVDVPVFVKRADSQRLQSSLAVSIAFNIARLHEDAGRTISAVELHKALLKKHPSYVNSYLRLACIARDCGSLNDCSEWLKGAVKVAPGNPEVLTLVGNLHLSLSDWAPAQSLFDRLLMSKNPNVEAYSQLSLGNIYFSNLNTPGKYTKHLNYAGSHYRRILEKDQSNFYAANGLGTILAEKAELFKAKEVFNRVREVSGDSIPDTLLNLGHIHLAQKKHPEALQMYQSYMNRTNKFGAGAIGKSKEDAEVLLYIAFAYFDWARQAELFNNAKAAPADERYAKCIASIELAMKSHKDNVLLKYNWCMVKLQAANCVLQKVTRNIPRTAQEVKDALAGLEDSLPIVQQLLQWKNEGKKVPISTAMLKGFISQCQGNIDSAKSHLSEELNKEAEARELRELQRIEALTQQKQREMQEALEKQRKAREQEERENKAKAKMDKVNSLVAGWEQDAQAKAAAAAKKKAAAAGGPPEVVDDDDQIYDNDTGNAANINSALFDSDDDDDSDDGGADYDPKQEKQIPNKESKSDSDDGTSRPKKTETEKDLFGDSSEDESSDEELVPASSKRELDGDGDGDASSNKKRRVVDED